MFVLQLANAHRFIRAPAMRVEEEKRKKNIPASSKINNIFQ